MRLLLYNIAYGTGTTGGFQSVFSAHRYLRTEKKYLDRIIDFIDSSEADVAGLVEIDTGSFRTGFTDQTAVVAKRLRNYRHCEVKYAEKSFARHIPILRRQANAFFSNRRALQSQVFYFPVGVKRVILTLDLEGIRFFLVHLALQRETRKKQFAYLAKLAAMNPGPFVIAGDFNAFEGKKELLPLIRTLNLRDPDPEERPTFPSGNPRFKLDYILCSKDVIPVSLRVPNVGFSDHLPVVFDFHL